MPTQYENPQAVNLEDEVISEASTTERIDHVAEKAAKKSAKTIQQYDKENSTIFSK
jgi:isocitrate/isopropylmalate dehydrogenase